MRDTVFSFILVLCFCGSPLEGQTQAQAQSPRLLITGNPNQTSGPALSISRPDPASEKLLLVEWSSDLENWRPFARSFTYLASYPTPASAPQAYFRAAARDAGASDDWTHQLHLDDPRFFAKTTPRAPAFVKFTVPLDDPADAVLFQNSNTHAYHYPFIVARVPGYERLTLSEFERIALLRDGQRLAIGTVLLAPDTSIREAAIQFAGNEVFPIERIAEWFERVRARIAHAGGAPWRFFYLPSFEQRQEAFRQEAYLTARDIRIATEARWITSHVCYSTGWAFGRLVHVPGDEIHAAYGDGRLTPFDILLTDSVPAEVPVLAGIIALNPATPNSHVAILAKSLRLPFAHLSGTAAREQWMALDGREILLVVEDLPGGACAIRHTDTTGKLTPEEREAILALKRPPPPEIQPREQAGAYHLDVEPLTPASIVLAGGKAANFGILRRVLPEHSPSPALALTFDLWDAFLDQAWIGAGGEDPITLAEAIDRRLAGFAYPPDVAQLRPALEEVRAWIRQRASFTPTQQASILEALTAFPPAGKLRFRSSTNVEDSDAFTGAGLYDSYSGCLADDLDGDDRGPSHCDPEEENERGVFRAIQRVYASFYNENAFIERLRHAIPEEDVGMAILVHPSFPDEDELANGVATMAISRESGGERTVVTTIVSQPGADSVTNPNPEARPEVVVTAPALTLKQHSSLSPGEPVLLWPDEYVQLESLLDRAARAYEAFLLDGETVLLDFEYKKMKPGDLLVKQIRRVPQLPDVPPPNLDL